MKTAFKTYSQAPQNEKPSGILDQWPWVVCYINDEDAADYQGAGYIVMTDQEYYDYRQQYQSAFDSWNEGYQADIHANALRVMDLVEDKFATFHESKIDFTIHLKPNIVLNKKVTMLANGRPEIAKYYLGDDLPENLVAEIAFEFDTNSAGFMTARREKLSYYKNNGTKSPQYTIHERFYDFAVPHEASESYQERVQARQNIFQEMKIVVNNYLIQKYSLLGNDLATSIGLATTQGKVFTDKYRYDIDDFIQLATSTFKNNVNSDVLIAWLDDTLAPGVTVKQYIVGRLTY